MGVCKLYEQHGTWEPSTSSAGTIALVQAAQRGCNSGGTEGTNCYITQSPHKRGEACSPPREDTVTPPPPQATLSMEETTRIQTHRKYHYPDPSLVPTDTDEAPFCARLCTHRVIRRCPCSCYSRVPPETSYFVLSAKVQWQVPHMLAP